MNILIKNIDIITADDARMVIKNGFIGIEDNIIKFAGDFEENIGSFKADRIIDGKNKLVLPGLVNAHSHSAMTLFRNFADDLALEDWLFKKIIPAEAKLKPDDIYWGAQLAAAEMIKSGTTCFADMYLHMDEVAGAVEESGIRANISKGPIVSNYRGKPGIAVDADGCAEFCKAWHNKANGRIKVYVEIHSVYLYDEESLKGAAELARQLGTGIHIHLLETARERETSIKLYGMDPVEACLNFGIFDVPVIAAHCVHLSDENINVLKDKGVNVVHNPGSNLKLGSGIARVPSMIDKGINVCLGTDGAASNNNLNLFEEMYLAATLHKGLNMNPMLINSEQAIKMATANGAKAVGFGSETGIIKEGMKADLIIADIDKSHLHPVNNLLSAVVYSMQAADVDTVIIDGNIVMENRELKSIDEEKVKHMVKKISKRLLS